MSDPALPPAPRQAGREPAGPGADRQVGELAREWALALVAQLPLARIGEVPLPALAEHAPALCAQLLRALDSDADLDLLAGVARSREQTPPACRLAALAGARDEAGAVLAAEALRGVLWEALLAEMGRRPHARWVTSATVLPTSAPALSRRPCGPRAA